MWCGLLIQEIPSLKISEGTDFSLLNPLGAIGTNQAVDSRLFDLSWLPTYVAGTRKF
jgi:hypothetical protein